MKVTWRLFSGILMVAAPFLPVTALADSVSVSQIITVTARVASARSIVVNNQGQMIKIYSNTAENVTPKVFLNDVPGSAQPLTPQLSQQYEQVIDTQKNLVGVAIPVAVPAVQASSLKTILMKSVSSLMRPLSL